MPAGIAQGPLAPGGGIEIEHGDANAAQVGDEPGLGEIAGLEQPEVVLGTWRAAREQDDHLTEAETREALERMDLLWEELFPAEQARIVRLLVERVDVSPTGADIRLRLDGLASLVRDLNQSNVDRLRAA